jgi:nucleolysin TIA-1/TIAR
MMHGQFIGARRVRCGWAQHKTDGASGSMDPQVLDRADPSNTNVYVGNLAPALSGGCWVLGSRWVAGALDCWASCPSRQPAAPFSLAPPCSHPTNCGADAEVRRHFGAFGPIAEVKLYRKGSYGFVRYKNHGDAVRAIVGMNGQVGAAAFCCCCCLLLLLAACPQPLCH